jgi:hypothetical protein
MKPKFRFLTVLNTAAAAVLDGINSARGVYQEMTLGEGEKDSRYRFVRYGEHPVMMEINGRVQRVIQVIDKQAVEEMASNYQSFRTQLATFFRGIPIYIGHADDPQWCKDNPGHTAAAVGRIKEITAGEEGMMVRSVFNTRGVDALCGEAPEYSGHSPRWRMKEIPERPGHYRPFLLWSDALTNDPNIPDSGMEALNQSPGDAGPENTTTENMELTPEALKALGFAPDAKPTPAEISTAVVKLLGEKASVEAAKATADTSLTAANSRNTKLQEELDGLRDISVVTAINTAITDGRITEAEKPVWEGLLKADFKNGSAALAKLKGNDALNTRNNLGDLNSRRGEGGDLPNGQDAMNEAAHAYAKEKGIDVSNAAGWTRAWEGAAAAKPEIFKRG